MFKITKLTPMFTGVLCTADKYMEPQYIAGSSLIDASKTKQGLKEYQTVLSVGPNVRDVKPGDTICINPSNYAVRKYNKNTTKESMNEIYNEVIQYNFNIVIVKDKECLLIQDRDIDFIIEGKEVEDPKVEVNIQPTKIIQA